MRILVMTVICQKLLLAYFTRLIYVVEECFSIIRAASCPKAMGNCSIKQEQNYNKIYLIYLIFILLRNAFRPHPHHSDWWTRRDQ